MSNNKSVLKVIPTDDGTATLFNEQLNEHYHSTHGALQESEYVYIKHGLELINKENINILEVGLGTGLNAALTLLYSEKNRIKINYTAIDSNSISPEMILEFCQFYPQTISEKIELLAKLSWEYEHALSVDFKFIKHLTRLQTFKYTGGCDLIYYDAFAPSKQADMWTAEVFKKLYSVLNPEGILVTYCAQGQLKRILKSEHFDVKSFPGPPGKREITVAYKNV